MRRRVVVFGSRGYPRPQDVAEYVMSLPPDTVVVSGCAPGPDSWALHVAADVCGLEIDPHPADWDRHKKAAGPIRNQEMAKVADEGMGFWDGYSKGTENMIKNLKVRHIPVTVKALPVQGILSEIHRNGLQSVDSTGTAGNLLKRV